MTKRGLVFLTISLGLAACSESGFNGSSAVAPPPAANNAQAVAKTSATIAVSKPMPAVATSAKSVIQASPLPPTLDTVAPSPVPVTPAVPATPQPPREGCQAFVTGLVLSDIAQEEISRVYQIDAGSEWVGAGSYPSNAVAFPKANKATFDGIALDPGTHMTIYAQQNFQGPVVFDGDGPIILNNIDKYQRFPEYFTTVYQDWDAPLQAKFPQTVRKLSETDMVLWGTQGSSIISCH